ncbi:MAG: S8 family peptidase [Geodermatophilaceae bacterium]|nr:S8 family peptidase [Geodermatophilaceae bacterium]
MITAPDDNGVVASIPQEAVGDKQVDQRWLLVAVTALVTASLAGPATAAPTGNILGANSATAVANSYIVVLKDTSGLRSEGVPAAARRLTERNGGSIQFVYETALRGFATTMSESNARRLAADASVDYVQQNQTLTATATQPNPSSWGLDRIDQRNLPLNNSYTYPSTASAVHAYVIDTGVRFTHSTFGGRATSGIDTIDNDMDANDCHGHGTHVAGTIGGTEYGVAKGVQIVGVRVLNCAGSGTTAQVVGGIDWVTANAIKPAVANMSLGGGPDPALDNATTNSIASGITYAVAAGNGNIFGVGQPACNYSPARVPTAVTVGATDITDRRASFSNYGTCVDIFAPGVNITSAWNGSDNDTETISGTSMAAPHVAGAAAMGLAFRPNFSPQQIRDGLVNRATNGVVINPGAGSPNKLLYVGR